MPIKYGWIHPVLKLPKFLLKNTLSYSAITNNNNETNFMTLLLTLFRISISISAREL